MRRAAARASAWASRRIATAVLAAGLVGGVPVEAASLADTIDKVRGSIVGVGTVQRTRRPPARFVGTGFVVADGRHVITNAHVVPGEIASDRGEFLAIRIGARQEEVRAARVVAMDPVHDLAVLEFKGASLPALRVGDAGRVREGELYAFTGFPIELVIGARPVTHRGIIAAITKVAIPQLTTRTLDARMLRALRDPYDVFQLDATAYPGNSGSPLYHPETGVVIGVINKVLVKLTKENVLSDPSAITYAIPATFVHALMKKAGLANAR